jgi:thiamine biosynthesis lipoprotein
MTSAGRDSALAASPRARRLLPVALLALVALSVYRFTLAGAAPDDALAGATMGTTWSVRVARPLDASGRERLATAVQQRLDEVDARMSTWRDDSELSRFNTHGDAPFPASAELFDVFRIAQAASARTGGAFDVTVSPIVAAWGFGATDRIPAPPAEAELERLRARTGFARIALDPGARTLRKDDPRVTADLSAVAKGWAVDRVGELLRAAGHADFLVEVGGEVLASGRRPDGERWRVAIERPRPGERAEQARVALSDLALATSGDYRNFYEADGRRRSHLIDPRTAHPIEHDLSSVSVAHPSAAEADALATALIVLGPADGPALAEREGWAAYFVVRDGRDSYRASWTAAFTPLLEAAP